jgi:hypothetical protein
MAYTTSGTGVEGLMETLQASATARFVIGSRLWGHVYAVASNNANTVQFPVYPAPTAATATAETSSLSTSSAISVTAATASPAQIGKATIISKKALLGGQMIREHAFNVLINDCIAGFDADICGEFDDFTTTGGDATAVASITQFRNDVSDLRNIGRGGQLHGCLTIPQVDLILASMSGYGAIPQNEEYIREGYIGRVAGVELVAVPDTYTTTSTNEVGAIWHYEFGIAVGYHAGDTITGVMEGTGAPAPLVHLEYVPIDVISVNLSAAVFSLASEISATGGIATKYALS